MVLRVPHRRRPSEPPNVGGVTAERLRLQEELNGPCRHARCPNRAVARCSYIDRRRHACTTAWCSDHLTIVFDLPYCRRHASVAPSLSNGFFNDMLPAVDSRALSLVNWVGSQLDSDVRRTLAEVAPHKHTRVVSGSVRPAYMSGGRSQCWIRSWNLIDSAGTLAGVALEVDEDDDCEVGVRIGGQLLGRLRPPWIGLDRAKPVAPEQDAAARQAFNDAIIRAVEVGLARHVRVRAA